MRFAEYVTQKITLAAAALAVCLALAVAAWYLSTPSSTTPFQIAQNRPLDTPPADLSSPEPTASQSTTSPIALPTYSGMIPNQPRDPLTILRRCQPRDPAVEQWFSQWQARIISGKDPQSNSGDTDSLRRALAQTPLPAEALLEVGLAMDKLDDHYAAAFFAEQGVNKAERELEALEAQGVKPGDPPAQRLCDALQVADETLWRMRGVPGEGVATLLKCAHLRVKWLPTDNPRMGWARLSEISWTRWPPGGMLVAVEKLDADIAKGPLKFEGNQLLELKWLRAMALADVGRDEEAATYYDDLAEHPTAWHLPHIKRMYAHCLARLDRENDAFRVILNYIDDGKLSEQAAYDNVREVQRILAETRKTSTSRPAEPT